MKLTPLDIRHQEFRRAMRGYSEEEVDVFLDEVADEFERSYQDNIELRERIQLLEEKLAEYEQLKETLNNTLVSAQQQADVTRANAHEEGELVLRDAELKARSIVSESYSEKQRVQQSLIQLRQIEEDFRFKFRSLLEAHINLLSEDEVSEERQRFRGLAAAVGHEAPAPPDDVSMEPPAVHLSGWSAVEESAPPEASEEPRLEPAVVTGATIGLGGHPPGIPDRENVSDGSEAAVEEPSPEEPRVDGLSADGPSAKAADDKAGDAEPSADEPSAGEAADESPGGETADDEDRGSSVRRFLFGKRDKPDAEGLFEQKDRDFEW